MMLAASVLIALSAIAAPVEQGTAARVVPAGTRCADAALGQLAAWQADLEHALADPPGPEGTRRARVPTGTLGVWVQIAVSPAREVWLERVSASLRESRRFGPRCEVVDVSEATGVERRRDGFTDGALAARLARGDTGVILVWSPHMPLSVDQYEVLAAVAREMGLALVPVLDPVADTGYARRVATERGLPEAALQPLAGIELAFRGMTTHAPSVQVFSGGRLVGPVLYGYRSVDAARLAIRGVLDPRPPQVRP